MLTLLLCTNTKVLLSFGFMMNPSTKVSRSNFEFSTSPTTPKSSTTTTTSSSSLNAWVLGRSGRTPTQQRQRQRGPVGVDVRIERPTPNSRRIMGEISIPGGVTVDDVWSILTDYNRLSVHVPNLKESRIVPVRKNNRLTSRDRSRSRSSGSRSGSDRSSSPGDGSYKCQLYQVGAQKIAGLDFSASVTMDMTERILATTKNIDFKCVDSKFFSQFDGSWTVREQMNSRTGKTEVLCSYDVLVRPKGPVPVAALEWRIREDVPTNLLAVKKAATLLAAANSNMTPPTTTTTRTRARAPPLTRLTPATTTV